MSGLAVENTRLDCPAAPQAILDMLRSILLKDVSSIVVKPGVFMEVAWTKHSVDEQLLEPIAQSPETLVHSLELQEVVSRGTLLETVAHTILGICEAKLWPGYLLVSDIDGFRRISGLHRSPYATWAQVDLYLGLEIVETDEKVVPRGKFIICAGPVLKSDLHDMTVGAIVPFQGEPHGQED